MLKPPVKDKVTIPWMSEREIPAIKFALSAWRKLRKDKSAMADVRDLVSLYEHPENYIETMGASLAWTLEKFSLVDARLRKEERQ